MTNPSARQTIPTIKPATIALSENYCAIRGRVVGIQARVTDAAGVFVTFADGFTYGEAYQRGVAAAAALGYEAR